MMPDERWPASLEPPPRVNYPRQNLFFVITYRHINLSFLKDSSCSRAVVIRLMGAPKLAFMVCNFKIVYMDTLFFYLTRILLYPGIGIIHVLIAWPGPFWPRILSHAGRHLFASYLKLAFHRLDDIDEGPPPEMQNRWKKIVFICSFWADLFVYSLS